MQIDIIRTSISGWDVFPFPFVFPSFFVVLLASLTIEARMQNQILLENKTVRGQKPSVCISVKY